LGGDGGCRAAASSRLHERRLVLAAGSFVYSGEV
jgi:hypothetical protein